MIIQVQNKALHSEFQKLPLKVKGEVFSYLEYHEINLFLKVNKTWKEVLENSDFWLTIFNKRIHENIRARLRPLVDNKTLTFKQALFVSPLFSFVDACVNFQMREFHKIPFVRFGILKFSIVEKTKIQVKTDEKNLFTLEGEVEIIDIQVDGDFVFAFRKDGSIDQWLYKERIKLQTIKTFVTGNENTELLKDGFIVRDGYILIRPKKREVSARQFQIICYKNLMVFTLDNNTPEADTSQNEALLNHGLLVKTSWADLSILDFNTYDDKNKSAMVIFNDARVFQENTVRIVESLKFFYKITKTYVGPEARCTIEFYEKSKIKGVSSKITYHFDCTKVASVFKRHLFCYNPESQRISMLDIHGKKKSKDRFLSSVTQENLFSLEFYKKMVDFVLGRSQKKGRCLVM